MALDATQTLIGVGAQILVASVGATAPTDASAAYSSVWTDIGYVDENGLTWKPNEPTIAEFFAWQTTDRIRFKTSSRKSSVQFNVQQWNKTTVVFAFGGGSVSGPVGGSYHYTPPAATDALPEKAIGFDWADGTRQYRLIYPRGSVIGTVETKLTSTALGLLPIEYGATAKAGSNIYDFYTTDAAAFA